MEYDSNSTILLQYHLYTPHTAGGPLCRAAVALHLDSVWRAGEGDPTATHTRGHVQRSWARGVKLSLATRTAARTVQRYGPSQ